MTADSKGRELFIVDNSVSGWTGLRYLEEWSSIAKAFDIATGYFEIGALLALEGKWQGLDRIRILMGAETTHRTRKAMLEAVRAQALDRLDESIEEDKEPNPFLHGVPAILDALRSGQIECRVYDKDKFHANAYITHASLMLSNPGTSRPNGKKKFPVFSMLQVMTYLFRLRVLRTDVALRTRPCHPIKGTPPLHQSSRHACRPRSPSIVTVRPRLPV